jgi:hypothetical protein
MEKTPVSEEYTWEQYLKDAEEFGFEPEDQDDEAGETTIWFGSRKEAESAARQARIKLPEPT